MYKVARNTPSKVFKIAYMGTDKNGEKPLLSGYTNKELADMFVEASKDVAIPFNVQFSSEWANAGFLNNANIESQSLDITKSNSVNISEDNSIISFLKNNIKKSEIILKAIENIEKVFNSENVKKIKTFAFALGDKVDLNKNTRSQLANINNLSNIENLINNVFEKGYLDKFKGNYSNLLESIINNNEDNKINNQNIKYKTYYIAFL